jgi:hypothetical protein
LDTGIALRDKHMKKYLEVDTYPIAQLTAAAGENGTGSGTLNIKGQHQKIEGKNLQAKFKLNLSDLKITGIRYMGAGVADDVTVTITLPIGDPPAKKSEAAKKSETVRKKLKYDTDEE